MRFVKMHACGNDYIYLDCIHIDANYVLSRLNAERISRACHRHYGIGADGVVLIAAGYRMIMFNADGSRGATCGNALRSVAHYLDLRYAVRFPISIETDAGRARVDKTRDGLYAVEMGTARIVSTGVCTDGTPYRVVDLGNRHAVCASSIEVRSLAEMIADEESGLNVERYRVLSADAVEMQVVERGTGYTLACGSGACAVGFDACTCGCCTFGIPITVRMDGGIVQVLCCEDGAVTLLGDAHIVYEGQYDF